MHGSDCRAETQGLVPGSGRLVFGYVVVTVGNQLVGPVGNGQLGIKGLSGIVSPRSDLPDADVPDVNLHLAELVAGMDLEADPPLPARVVTHVGYLRSVHEDHLPVADGTHDDGIPSLAIDDRRVIVNGDEQFSWTIKGTA